MSAKSTSRPRAKKRRLSGHKPQSKPAESVELEILRRKELLWRKKLAAVRDQLRESRDTLEAIRTGEVDALVMSGKNGHKVYSLSGAEEPYRVYVEHMQEGAVTVSAEGLVLYCNQRFADMLDLALEKVIGAHLSANLSEKDWKTVLAVVKEDRGVVKHESMLQRAGGRPLPVHLTASKLPLGELDVICLVVTDLTEQKEKAELRVAKEVAEKANAEKDDFLAKLSHELRTPLTPTLIAAGELEQNTDLPDDVRQDLAMIRRNVELEARLIDDLLDLTRIAHGKLELHRTETDIHTIVRRAIAICQPDVDAKKIALQFIAGAPRPNIEGDAIRLEQAVWNLLRNAVKFTPEQGAIEIRAGNVGPRVFVEVRDTGIGFKADAGPRLFRAFEQEDKQITRRFGGLGLGLAITRSIVESHQGTVIGHSPGPGRGATFRLELPGRVPGETKVPAGDGSAVFLPVKAARSLKILLVEDHKDTRFALELILTRSDHRVKSASTAQAALELAAAERFDLVISDLGLPDQSGLEMMAQLRDRFGLKGIAVSGYGMEDDVVRSREAGFVHHLTKPISMEGLRKMVAGFSPAGETAGLRPNGTLG